MSDSSKGKKKVKLASERGGNICYQLDEENLQEETITIFDSVRQQLTQQIKVRKKEVLNRTSSSQPEDGSLTQKVEALGKSSRCCRKHVRNWLLSWYTVQTNKLYLDCLQPWSHRLFSCSFCSFYARLNLVTHKHCRAGHSLCMTSVSRSPLGLNNIP